MSPRSTFHAVWVSRVKLGRTFEAKQFSDSDHIKWMISLCLSTHPSEEASSPDHWFSNMIGHQAHSQMDYKDRFLAPSQPAHADSSRVRPRNPYLDSSYSDSAVSSVAFKRLEMKFEARLAASVILWPIGLEISSGAACPSHCYPTASHSQS